MRTQTVAWDSHRLSTKEKHIMGRTVVQEVLIEILERSIDREVSHWQEGVGFCAANVETYNTEMVVLFLLCFREKN